MKKKKLYLLLVVVFTVSTFLLIKMNDSKFIKVEGKTAYAEGIHKDIKGLTTEKVLKGKTIIIDAGHGGKDDGSSGQRGTLEKDVTLKMAKEIQREFAKKSDATVILTRDQDDSVTLGNRVELANKENADLFISIHFDAFTSNDVEGITTYYNKEEDLRLATLIHSYLFNQDMGTRDRGVKLGDYFVLRENTQPSILLELGFISNKEDEKRIISQAFQTKASIAIVEGVIEYLSK
ncbi:N-acetylmuramoyl-L-alanine amidase [Sporosarcina sp. NPDC096371]|uniref:N-acetylmuramoyl-L-alanine amidase family protein n=1 Tax=Sporosarcina sp. NPDC096371 TaxID=3364530 RepID=UPI00381694D8